MNRSYQLAYCFRLTIGIGIIYYQKISECVKDSNPDEHRAQVSRLRRTIDSEFSQRDQIQDLEDQTESRIEGLEEFVRQSRNEISGLRRKLTRLSRRVIEPRQTQKGNPVCVDFDGNLRNEEESWIHSTESSDACAECECKVKLNNTGIDRFQDCCKVWAFTTLFWVDLFQFAIFYRFWK